jgi:hypothetical protein
MKLIPKILETKTRKGEITIVRRRYLKSQIANGPTDMFNALARVSFNEGLNMRIDQFEIELIELLDTMEQYNS